MRAQAPYATVGAIESSLVRTSRFVRDTRYGLPDAAAALHDLATPAPRLSPTVHGLATVGHELEAFSGLWVGSGVDVGYQWERCSTACTPIPGASSRTYTPVAADGGRSLRVVATAGSIGTTASPRTRVVEAAPRVLRFPEIVGAPSIGARLTATLGAWRGTNLRFSVVWLRCKQPCERVATGRSYRVKAADRGHRFVAEVVASNSAAARTARSRPTRIVR
jgi:hypothetical protein